MNRIIMADIGSVSYAGGPTGHCFAVAQNYLDMFKQHDEIVVAGGPIYQHKFSANLLQLPYNHVIGESKLKEKWHELMNCCTLFKQVRSEDILIMQSIALVTAYMGIILFLHKPCRLFFIQYNTESISNPIKRILWKMVTSKVHGIITTFPSVALAYKKPYILIPDYVYTDDQPTSFPSFDERKYDICMLGHIYRDKGVVEALRHLIGKGLKIVVAGKVGEPDLEPEIRDLVKEDKDIELYIGYLPDETYHAYLANSKYCMLNYRGSYNEHSSGVVYESLFHGTPVLATKTMSTKMINEYKLGISFDNVTELDTSRLFNSARYEECQLRISQYLLQQREIIIQLSQFVHKV